MIEAADLNGLLRAVDGLCARRAWDDLVDLADRCEAAVERGKQLWPIAEHIDYRLALEAPADYATSVLTSAAGRFSLGPLTEVAASTHTWAELAPHVEEPQIAAYLAQERVLRGEVLEGDDRAHPEVLDLPLTLEPWEPTYALATYSANHVEVAEPWQPSQPWRHLVAQDRTVELDRPELVAALLDLVQPWTTESNGAARAVVVEGDALAAVSGVSYGELRFAPLNLDEALRLLGWAAASGGAHGRRRGAAMGRFMAWYAVSLLCGFWWPVDPRQLAAELERLRWHRWDEGEPEEGWVLRLAVEVPDEGWSAAIAATDVLEEPDRL